MTRSERRLAAADAHAREVERVAPKLSAHGDTGRLLLRTAQPADADAVARVHVRSWQVAYRGLLPDAYLDGLRPEDRAHRYTFGELEPERPQTIVAIGQEADPGSTGSSGRARGVLR